MAQAALPLMLAASVVSAAGQYMSGQAMARGYEQNAAAERTQATNEIVQSTFRAGQIADETSKRTASQKAAYGAAGVVTGTGTPLEVMANTALKGEMAKQTALYQGRLNATAHLTQSDTDLAEASAQKTASYISAASTLLTGGGRAAQMSGNIPGGG